METKIISNKQEAKEVFEELRRSVAEQASIEESAYDSNDGSVVSKEQFLQDIENMSYEEAAAIMSSTDDDDYLFCVAAMRLAKED